MKIKSYHHIGKRENNEDAMAIGQNTFIVCDGVGGREKGEVASEFVANNLLDTIENSTIPVKDDLLQIYIKNVQEGLNNVVAQDFEKNGMATTLAMFHIEKDNALVAHIGDSRVYYIKPKDKLFWRTKDHSLVTELVDSGIITEEQALTHPMRNRITRAIQGNKDNKTVKANITTFTSVEKGDLIFICSDGVTESLTDENLLNILGQDSPIKEKLSSIQNICKSYSKDNNTAILLKIEEKDTFSTTPNPIELKPFPVSSSNETDSEEEDNNSDMPILNDDEQKKEIPEDKPLDKTEDKPDNLNQVQESKSPEKPNTEKDIQENIESSNVTEKNQIVESNNDVDVDKSVQQENDEVEHQAASDQEEKNSNSNILMLLVFLIVIATGGYWAYTKFFQNPTRVNTDIIDTSENTQPSSTKKASNKSRAIRIDNKNESRAYSQAKQFNSIEAYKQYINNFPNGTNVKNAKNKIATLKQSDENAWNTAVKSKDYGKYISDYPNGIHIAEAKSKAKEINAINKENQAFNTAKQKNTIDALKDFINNYPNGKNINEAKTIIEAMIKKENAKSKKIKNKNIEVKK